MKQIKELPENGKFVVLFTSDHCPHCKKMEKNLKQIEKKYQEKGIEFYTINISRNQEIALKYNIMSVPFTVFMNGKKLVGKEAGAVSIKAIELELEELIKDGEFVKKIKRLFGFK
ncbi:thioredoxin family protein [Hippea alviniae]|uniref:thioredoxin family protein n=1 Tax=Hippea alviniae TaxID=1279027 RepID=UPI0003B4DA83|nr:thioredoxin family protein [Hippea alviniae]